MSENVCDFGWMAKLKELVDSEAVNEILYDDGSCLSVNYDGTLIYSEHRTGICGITVFDECYKLDFVNELNKHGLEIVGVPRPYFDNWYNGADSYRSEMALEGFDKQ